MREVATIVLSSTAIRRLDSLLRGELAAIASYERVLADGALSGVREVLRRAGLDHGWAANALRAAIQALGGTPSETAGVWGAFSRLAEGAAGLFGDRLTLLALREGEELGLAELQAAIAEVDEPSRLLIQEELMPHQRRRVMALSAILKDLKP